MRGLVGSSFFAFFKGFFAMVFFPALDAAQATTCSLQS
jgi:hypothetical protein